MANYPKPKLHENCPYLSEWRKVPGKYNDYQLALATTVFCGENGQDKEPFLLEEKYISSDQYPLKPGKVITVDVAGWLKDIYLIEKTTGGWGAIGAEHAARVTPVMDSGTSETKDERSWLEKYWWVLLIIALIAIGVTYFLTRK